MKFYLDNYSNLYDKGCRTNWNNMQNKYPALNIIEKNNEYLVEVELPGFTIDDINLKLEKHVLKISTRKLEKLETEEEKTFLLKERVKKEFERSLSLGSDVDEDKLSATLKNGLLVVKLPKMNQALPRSIKVV